MTRFAFALPLAALVAAGFATGASAANVEKGEKLFKQRCQICHAVEKDKKKIGPSLFGAAGRKAGTESYFTYSPALKSSGLTWDDPTLDKWITDPHKVVKTTKMSFPGLKNQEQRADIIAYLHTLK